MKEKEAEKFIELMDFLAKKIRDMLYRDGRVGEADMWYEDFIRKLPTPSFFK